MVMPSHVPLLSPLPCPSPGPPQLLVVVDTEEEFDWLAPFSRESRGVTAMAQAWRLQSLCRAFDIRPTWVVDWPVAEGAALDPLLDWTAAGAAQVGAHLHPWVTPPYEEELTRRNSYPGNLPAALEHAKLERLTRLLESRLGASPRIYKAGRYGLGPQTPQLLADLGYQVDLSIAAGFDASADGGPDHSCLGAGPARYTEVPSVCSLPTTGGWIGWLGGQGALWQRRLHRPPWGALRLPGVAARLGGLRRVRLSPEGFTCRDMMALTRALLARGERVFTVSLHSPSLQPGCTPYVRDRAQREQLLATLAEYFAFFLGELGGVPSTPLDLIAEWTP
ncbi:MAG: polysaccharide deacetylase family protein [Magnetococcus sp. WYHC-3]